MLSTVASLKRKLNLFCFLSSRFESEASPFGGKGRKHLYCSLGSQAHLFSLAMESPVAQLPNQRLSRTRLANYLRCLQFFVQLSIVNTLDSKPRPTQFFYVCLFAFCADDAMRILYNLWQLETYITDSFRYSISVISSAIEAFV